MLNHLHEISLGHRTDVRARSLFLWLALIGFGIHLGVWSGFSLGLFDLPKGMESLFRSPLISLYTPFSILLVYEVYELIQVLHQSFSRSMIKQFEVTALIVVRDAIKATADADVQLASGSIDQDLLFLLMAKGLVFLGLLAICWGFQRETQRQIRVSDDQAGIGTYIQFKKFIAFVLFASFVFMALKSLIGWTCSVANGGTPELTASIFFSDFFSLLILADISILLLSYRFTNEFHSLARNTGFVLSTIILRLALESSGFTAPILFMTSGLIGYGVLLVTGWSIATLQDQRLPRE